MRGEKELAAIKPAALEVTDSDSDRSGAGLAVSAAGYGGDGDSLRRDHWQTERRLGSN